MKVRLDRKCPVNHNWDHVADFRFAADARPCATLLSKLDDGVYRVTDTRWPEEGDDVTVFVSGEVAGG